MTIKQSEESVETEPENTFSHGIEWTANSAHEAIEVLSELSRPLVADMLSSAHQAVDIASGIATSATRSLGISEDAIKDTQQKLVDAVRLYVQEYPLATLSLAVLAGFAADRMLSKAV